jgi:hypothetical protein
VSLQQPLPKPLPPHLVLPPPLVLADVPMPPLVLPLALVLLMALPSVPLLAGADTAAIGYHLAGAEAATAVLAASSRPSLALSCPLDLLRGPER